MYFAIKNKMDYLLFVDDDEYPLASIRTPDGLQWKGQQVLATHLKSIENADITHGHHCGYVSPIPSIQFNDTLTEKDFQLFIETISNDVITWDSIKEKILDGGVTFADESVINSKEAREVQEVNGAKFISGSNLFIKLDTDHKIHPFYNPPGARGEDTFLSTCLTDLKVLKVPCYTFHDGFAAYPHLLFGSLPENLKPICSGNHEIDERFFEACIGWIRYKPLLLYITNRENYERDIEQMKANLDLVLPKVCSYFTNFDFNSLKEELELFSNNVEKHYEMFEMTKKAWATVLEYLSDEDENFFDSTIAEEG